MLTKSETNNAIVTRLCNVRTHPNADRLKLATVLGAQVIVGLEAKENDLVIYFDSNLRLSRDYLHHNNLYSEPSLNLVPNSRGYFGKSGRVRCQRFRGEVSNGYVASIESLLNIPTVLWDAGDIKIQKSLPKEGDEFTHIDGVEICSKYFIPVKNNQGQSHSKKRSIVSTMFYKHWDTKQLMRELDSIPDGANCWIEEKIHGTSGRTANVLCETNCSKWKFWKPKEEWKIVSGTRRVDNIGSHIPEVRKEIELRVAPHLRKGEEIYYEIFGYNGGSQIQEGYPYNCRPGKWRCMLYRVTITTPDGFCFDLSRQQVYKRAEELGLEKPFVFRKSRWINLEPIERNHPDVGIGKEEIQNLCFGRSHLDTGTLLEGIVVWFEDNDGKWTCLKHKSPEFLLDQDKKYEKEVGDVEDHL